MEQEKKPENKTVKKKTRSDKLTPKQLKFAKKYVELGNASEAYRQSYNTAGHPETVKVNASKLLNGNANVALTVKAMEEKLVITTESQVQKLEKIYQLAMMKEELNPAINAVNSQSKHKGLLNETGMTVNVNLNKAESELENVTPETLGNMLALMNGEITIE